MRTIDLRYLSSNARELLRFFPRIDRAYDSLSVNAIAQTLGWGWHRTNNTLKELGYR